MAQGGWVIRTVYWIGELRRLPYPSPWLASKFCIQAPVQHNVQEDRIQFWSLDFASANATARRPSHGHTLVWGCANVCKPLHPLGRQFDASSLDPGKDISPHHHSKMAHPQ